MMENNERQVVMSECPKCERKSKTYLPKGMDVVDVTKLVGYWMCPKCGGGELILETQVETVPKSYAELRDEQLYSDENIKQLSRIVEDPESLSKGWSIRDIENLKRVMREWDAGAGLRWKIHPI